MLTPAMASLSSYFYPIGNTPAVCLTQSMPPGVPATVLLLGCGDVRHILFTRHMDDRRMDVTCCDNQKGVIARNALLLSLIIDDKNDQNRDVLWNIYYNMRIDQKDLHLLRAQAKKLYECSTTMRTWRQSEYGFRLVFCDSRTLSIVRKVWSFYAADTPDILMHHQMRSARDRALYKKAYPYSSGGLNFAGFRSAVPAHSHLAEDMAALHRNYWDCGKMESSTTAVTDHHNPTFLVGDETVDIHYGIDPLQGFHLATAYGPLSPSEPLSAKLKDLSQKDKIVATARDEFYQWMASYREHLSNTKIRLFNGDAVAFAHTLHHKRVGRKNTAHWYRDRSGLQPLKLDGQDYMFHTAPVSFDIIDTSNLCDHLGSLTLLTAVSPLLRDTSSSVLFTEVLTKHHDTYKSVLDNILCGYVPTLTTLLGLFPFDYWTNTSVVVVGGEHAFRDPRREAFQDAEKRNHASQIYLRISWKRPESMMQGRNSLSESLTAESSRIRFDTTQLSRTLLPVYVQMFSNKYLEAALASDNPSGIQKYSLLWYTHASFASFLRFVKTRVTCDWEAVMESLIELITVERNVPPAKNYLEELFTYLHVLGVYSTDALQNWDQQRQDLVHSSLPMSPVDGKWRDLRDWRDMPAVVCVTLIVPREKLEVFTTMDRLTLNAPPVYCAIKSAGSRMTPWRNKFYACQLAFGKVSTRGEQHSDSFEVVVEEDDAGWEGSSPLIAVFYAPALYVLLQPREARVTFNIHRTQAFSRYFSPKIGSELKVHETILANSRDVYVTRHAPHKTEFPVIAGAAPAQPPVSGPISSLIARVNEDTGHIVEFTGRLHLSCDSRSNDLRGGCKVHTSAASPYEIAIHIGKTPPLIMAFPVYVSKNNQDVKIARGPSCVEFTVQVANCEDWMKYAQYMYPVRLDAGKPETLNKSHVQLLNMPYLQLLKCPVIDADRNDMLSWLIRHTTMMKSYRERAQLNTLIALFASFGSLYCQPKPRIYSLHDVKNNHVKILIMVNSLRMNLADRGVVLDCAVIPMWCWPREISLHLSMYLSYQKVTRVAVSDAELELWRRILPVYVERCRTWHHRAACEYASAKKVPLTTEDRKQFLCSCGNGEFPEDYEIGIPGWEEVKEYAVRAAISPLFSAPFNDEAPIRRPVPRCDVCRKTEGPDGGALLVCARCGQTKYCSRECQVAHWNEHKEVCEADSD